MNAQLDNSCSITVNGGITIESSPRSAQLSTSIPYLDHRPWTQLDNIYLPDNKFVETVISPFKKSELLIVNNFDFSIPNNAKITGIEVRLIGNKTGVDSIHDKRIQLIDNTGSLIGQDKRNKAIYGSEWSQDSLNNKKNWKYGSNQDLWEVDWTPQMINSPAFGLGVQVQNLGNDDVKVMLDQVMIRIYYIPAIDICEEHACISVYSVPEADVIDYEWNVSSGLVHQDSTNAPYVINVYADQSPFGDYEVCLTKTYFNNSTSTCCRNITYRPCQQGSIGNYVWLDSNGNGNQDAGEPGLDNVRVFLFNESEQYLAESITSNGGQYRFDGLKPGNYFVHVSNYDYCPTIGQGNSDNTDSDFLQAIKPLMSKLVTLETNQNISNIDFGLIKKGAVSGLAWIDKNGNGQINNDDELATGIEVQLQRTTGDVLQTTVTDAQGQYIFDAVPPGDYIVYFAFSSEFKNTTMGVSLIDSLFKTSVVMLENGGLLEDINAGVFRVSTIGDLVWYDVNENGVFDSGENGLPNVSVTLEDCNGNLLGEVMTDSSGNYTFNQVSPGDFIVCAESDRLDLRPLETSNVNVTGAIGCSECISVIENSTITNIDFALINAFVEINVNVWFDNNINGLIDSTELFVDQAVVNLYDCNGTLLDTVLTSSSGIAIFDSLLTGMYYVELIAPSGEVFSMASDITNSNGLGTSDCFDTSSPVVSVNLGLVQLSSIGDFVWNDLDRDGMQDLGEPGIPEVQVRLLDCTGEVILETQTDSLGAYAFNDLLTGEYTICTDYSNADYIPTLSNVGSVDLDSNFSDTLSITCSECFYVEPNTDDLNIDFGFVRKQSEITVNVWEDLNYSNSNDAEPNVASIGVTLYNCSGQLLRSTTTDTNGIVVFQDLFLEEYYVELDLGDGLSIHPNSAFDDTNGPFTTDCFLLEETGTLIEAPIVELSSVGNFVWIDENANGLQDDSEPGLPNVIVSLQDCNGLLISQTTTDSNGAYLFDNVLPDEYVICLDNPGEFFTPTEFVAGNDAQNSDFDLSNGSYCTSCFNTEAFSDYLDVDFGFTRDVSNISVELWYDEDGDGRFDANEAAAEGIIVTLYECSGVEVTTATSDINGNVYFEEVGVGSYYIEAELLTGYNFSDNTSINGANGEGTSACFNLGSTDAALEVGYIGPASIGDFVWLDVNDNGRQDPDEVGVEGIVLNLLNANGVIQQTTTSDANGQYLFDDLSPGVYRIILVSLSSNYTLSRSGQSSSDLDSDFDAVGTLISTSILTLSSNQNALDIDLGLVPGPSQISGFVWRDSNGDMLNVNESGQEGISVGLYTCENELVSEQLTDAQGAFTFANVTVGEYYVSTIGNDDFEFVVGGDSDITDLNGTNTSDCFVVDGTAISLTVGATPMSNMRTQVFIDENENGIIESTDMFVPNATVVLRDINDNAMDMQQTNNDGEVAFDNIYPGQYKLELLDVDMGLAPTILGQGDETIDSDLIFVGGRYTTEFIELSDGIINEDIDLGLIWISTSLVSGNVWRDSDGNIVQDNSESGFENLIVQLFNCDGTLYATTETDDTGTYEFVDVPSGEYYLKFEDHSAFEMDASLSTNFSTLNSLGETTCFAVENISQVVYSVAMIPLSNVGDFVWLDENGNGQQDLDEPGIQGLELLLLNENDEVLSSTFTDANGDYTFENLRPDTYRLEVLNVSQNFIATAYSIDSDDSDSNLTNDGNRFFSDYFTLIDGADDFSIDLGFREDVEQMYEINGFVWEDVNGDGILNANTEPGQNGVIVNLYNDNDVLVQVETTKDDANGIPGYYSFTDLEGGSYYVFFELDEDAKVTLINSGNDNQFNSHITLGNKTNVIDMNTPIETLNAGYYFPSSIGDFVWNDTNANGTQDSGESGFENVNLELYNSDNFLIDTYVSSNVDSIKGFYAFENIRPGSYYIKAVSPSGYVFTDPLTGGFQLDSDITDENGVGTTYTIDLLSNQNVTNVDIGFTIATGIIGDLVWDDANGNGIFDADEVGVENVTIRLHTTDDSIVNETITSAAGNYIFNNVPQGEYYLSIVMPANFNISPSNASVNEAVDSDFEMNNGVVRSHTFSLASGEVNLSIDAGVFSPAQVGDFVWTDYNSNGIQDVDEVGYGGLTIELYDGNDNLILSTVTDDDGQYLFSDISAGEYYVKFVQSGDIAFTESEVGANVNSDSDANADGLTDIFTIAPREVRRDIDAGVITPINIISGKTWFDANEDGILQITEDANPNVTVWLLDATGTFVLHETTTNEEGEYAFYDMEDGSYVLQFLPLSGFAFTGQFLGSDMAVDSDVDDKGYTGKLILVNGSTILDNVSAGYVNISKKNLTKLYPNPAFGDNIQLDVNNIYSKADVIATIYDSHGKMIETIALYDNLEFGKYKRNLSLEGLKEGVYLVKLKIAQKTEYHQLMIFK